MLVRRLKERCAGVDLVHIGTIATMISRPDASAAERRQSVADFATRFFGHPFGPEQVIEETLVPFTEGGRPSTEELKRSLASREQRAEGASGEQRAVRMKHRSSLATRRSLILPLVP
jgi:hypothetical protein